MRLIAVVLLVPSLAWAQDLTYDAPGRYVLAADSTSTGLFNIKIVSDDVTLDLGGHTVRCDPPDPLTTKTFGIYANNRSNVIIRNGAITGCQYGIHASYSSGVVVANVDFTGTRYVGVSLGGSGAHITGNTFAGIGGWAGSGYAIGINSPGHDALIEGNVFHNLYRQSRAAPGLTGQGVGVIVSSGETGVVIRGNGFTNDVARQGENLGVWVADGASAIIERNQFVNFDWPIGASKATVSYNTFWLQSGPGHWAVSVTEGSANDNLIVGWEQPWHGDIVDAGGNVAR